MLVGTLPSLAADINFGACLRGKERSYNFSKLAVCDGCLRRSLLVAEWKTDSHLC